MKKKINNQIILTQINQITKILMENSFLNSTSGYCKKSQGKNNIIEISPAKGPQTPSDIFKNESYLEMYEECRKNYFYNFELIRGELVSMYYKFDDDIISHRLAYFPSPWLFPYIISPDELYLNDYETDIIDMKITHVPLRFDFDRNSAKDIIHPASHLTLGQFECCRIPVSSPLTPVQFITFILKCFYSNYKNYPEVKIKISNLNRQTSKFKETITENERKETYIQV